MEQSQPCCQKNEEKTFVRQPPPTVQKGDSELLKNTIALFSFSLHATSSLFDT
jgi:hypothetical protein